jgi:hypothetical protein
MGAVSHLVIRRPNFYKLQISFGTIATALGEYAGEHALLATEASIHIFRTTKNTRLGWGSVCRNFKKMKILGMKCYGI